MDFDFKLPDDYLRHKVFEDLKYMMEFYDSLSTNCHSIANNARHGIINYASYVYSAILGTLDSISNLLEKGSINDAYSMIRKLFDDILLEIYMDVKLKDNFDDETGNAMIEFDEWIRAKHRIPKSDKILHYLKTSERTKDIYPFFSWDTHLKKNRELLDDSIHSNRFYLLLLNCNALYIDNRERHLTNCEVILNHLFIIHLSFVFHLNPSYLMASDYLDYMELGQTPPVGCEKMIAPFAQDAYNKILKSHKSIAEFIKRTCPLEIE